ncbi:MAG: hypothetical protein QM784_06380 [Polyangiaceae bacterium]
MKRVCAWCKKELGEAGQTGASESDAGPPSGISHGICVECVENLGVEDAMGLDEFLDTIEAPVAVVDDEQREAHVNSLAQGLQTTEVEPRRLRVVSRSPSIPPPELRDCVISGLPGGCKRDVHCTGCTIRRAVMQTYRTGKPISHLPACTSKEAPDAVEYASHWVSTALVGDVVFVEVTPNPKS